MNEKELYDVLTRKWSPARIETLELLIKHGPLTIAQIGTLRNIKPLYVTNNLELMYKKGLIEFEPHPTLKIRGDISISSYLKRKNIMPNTKIFSKISLEEFNAFKQYSKDIRIKREEERRLASIRYELRQQFFSVIPKLNEEKLLQALKYIHELYSNQKVIDE